MHNIVVCAMYKFVTLDNYQDLRQPLLDFMLEHDVRGTLLLAQEGINGTVAGSREAIDFLLGYLKADPRLATVSYKESLTDTPPFMRTRVKLKKEIVTMGVEGIDPKQIVGTYVKPAEWNELISSPDVLLVDTRNDYEVQVGTFKNAINPKTDSFREFPEYVKNHLDPKQHKRVAMFCTGGIRCEKSTAYLKEQGFEEVYHLEGGILKYLEDVPEEETLWEGDCFVFDERVTVNHSLEKGHYDQCHACRLPITEEEKQSPLYQRGVSCPHCYDKTTDEQKARYAEREKQIELARQRGEAHIGLDSQEAFEKHRAEKQRRRELDRQSSKKTA
ncbi:hypothetical protein LCGC14_1378710 [marine sediment metagenome]|uniref:Rhodanese domain-containing protein n=1 Tax=marine sediment metagenome TaxID=412755 RepID=A0A0F9KP84_9ZZZZ